LAPSHTPEAVLAKLSPPTEAASDVGSDAFSVMLVGHEPSISELASFLLTGSPDGAYLPFKKGAVAAIEVGSLPPRSPGKLLWFLAPKQLRALAPAR
jgi:phosphohistidine phosphatase SixA